MRIEFTMVNVRRMRLDDYPRIFAVRGNEQADFELPFTSSTKRSKMLRVWNAFNLLLSLLYLDLALKKFVIFGAFDGSKMIGFSMMVVSVIPYEFAVFVNENYRKRGIGKKLTKEALDYADETGNPVFLTVKDWNSHAKRMYEKLGFKEYEKAVFMERSCKV